MPANGIRLAICDTHATRRAAMAARVRGAEVEECDNLDDWHDLLARRDAILLVAEMWPPPDVMESLFAAAKEANRQLVIANPDRYLPSRQLIRKQLAGPLGDVGLVRMHRWEPFSEQTSELPDALLRDLDVALWLVGRQPNLVFTVEQVADPLSQGRSVQVHLGFPGGAMALLDFDNRLPAGQCYRSLSVIAANGAAYADDHQNMQLLYRGGQPQAIRTDEHAAFLTLGAQELIDAIAAGRDLMTANAMAWQDVFSVAQSAWMSLESGQAVEIKVISFSGHSEIGFGFPARE